MKKKQDDELDKLEDDIRKLKNMYDQFFTGITKMPPMTARRALESYIHDLQKAKIRDNGRRFRMNTLLSRYNQLREMWGRRMREKEEGPLEFRRRQAALSAPPPPPPPPSEARVRGTSSNGDPYVKVAPGTNGEEIRKLYEEINKQHLELGKAPSITVEQLTSMVEKQSEMVRSKYHVSAVAFRVETVDGKVKLKAKPLQD